MGSESPRRLLLVRHAKTEQVAGKIDHDRELLPRGVADARAGGRWLAERGPTPDLVLCSTATRARQTWEHIAAGAGLDVEVWTDRRIYNAYPDEILAVIREAPEDRGVVVVVGHAPGIPDLGAALADPAGSDDAALAALRAGMPTAVGLEFQFAGDWAELTPDSAALVGYRRWQGSEEAQ